MKRLLTLGLLGAWLLTGCSGEPPRATYAEHVAPILDRSCVPCHRAGSIAPFPLQTYDEARRRASQIETVTQSGYMPPWLPAPGHGEFAHDRRLNEQDLLAIQHWVEDGAREGDRSLRPEPPQFSDGWQLGEPDLVLTMTEPFTLPSEGRDVFRNFVIPATHERSRHVRAFEFKPDNPRVVHHAVFQVDTGSGSRELDAASAGPGFDGMDMGPSIMPDGQFLGWTPGHYVDPGSEDIGWKLDPGSDLVMQLHMPTTGKPETLQASIGLYFNERPPTRHPFSLMLGSEELDIPAGDPAWEVEDRFVLPVAVEALGVYPHAHYLGKEIEVTASLPGGGAEPLLKILDWDFNWQDEYRYARPVPLPAGSEIKVRFRYDNSATNPRNPNHPPRRVTYGNQSSDEMAYLLLRLEAKDAGGREALETAQLRHYLAKDDSKWRARRRLAVLLMKRGAFAEAAREIQAARLEAPDDPLNLTLAGQLAGRQGNLPEAVRLLGRAVELDPSLVSARTNLGVALMAGRRPADAEQQFRAALELDAGALEPRINLAMLLRARGARGEARELLQGVLADLPATSPLRRGVLRQLEGLGEG